MLSVSWGRGHSRGLGPQLELGPDLLHGVSPRGLSCRTPGRLVASVSSPGERPGRVETVSPFDPSLGGHTLSPVPVYSVE